MRHLQRRSAGSQMIVDPSGEKRGFHRRRPRLRQRLHPVVQIQTRGENRAFGVNRATAIFHAVADGPLKSVPLVV